jgi:hypothetical protein
MIKSLRKRHVQVWMAWAILLPVGIMVSWLSIPKQPVQSLLQAVDKADTCKPVNVSTDTLRSYPATNY